MSNYKILTLIEKELDQVTHSYEKQLLEKEEEILSLKKRHKEIENTYINELNAIKKEKTDENNISLTKYEWLLKYLSQKDDGFELELMTKIYGKDHKIVTPILFDLLNDYIYRNDLNPVHQLIDLLQNNTDPILNNNLNKEFNQFILNLLLFDFSEIDQRHDAIFIKIFKLLQQLNQTIVNIDFQHMLEEKFEDLFEQVLYINMPEVTIEFMRTYRLYNIEQHLAKTISHIINIEWDFIESSLSQSSFNIIFWYAYLYDVEQDLISKLDKKRQYLLEKNEDISAYLYIKECENNCKNISSETYRNKLSQSLDNQDLIPNEKQFIMKKLNADFDNLIGSKKVIVDKSFRNLKTNTLDKHTSQDDPGEFRDESALKELGYQITGMNRIKRWEILVEAVPQLGLKRVAYIISHHIRMRKGQKDGAVKFKNAITEWEYDLQKLKETYYDETFNWPIY